MSDPFSITAGVIGLVAQSIKSVQTVQNYVSRYKLADLSVTSTRTECSAIRIALLQIQDLLSQNEFGAEALNKDNFSSYAIEEYEGVLSACSIAFSVLNERLTELNVHSLDHYNESTFRSKLNTVWNDDEMNVLRQNIRGQAIAINLLLSAFQAGSSAKTYQLLKERKNRSILKAVSDDTRTLLAKSYRARTITQKDDLESTGSVIGDEVFDFDDLVINSAAYRRAYYSYTIKAPETSVAKKDNEEKNEEKTETGEAIIVPSFEAPDFLVVRDEDYFETRCQHLYDSVHQWVRRFSKYSDMQACRHTMDINNDRLADRIDNAVLDGSDVDTYLADRVKRRDVFMSTVMTMIWEFVFTRYLFGMDREHRQKLKSLEKVLREVGPPSAVALWRAITLTLFSKSESFTKQKLEDADAVAREIFETLAEILMPPSRLHAELEDSLRNVVKSAVDLSVEIRTQQAEYLMLPPLQPEYDMNGDLTHHISFSAVLMNERSGSTVSNDDFDAQQAVVRFLLFPLVVKKGDDSRAGDEEVVIFPAQVLVSREAKQAGILSNKSMVSVAPSERGTM